MRRVLRLAVPSGVIAGVGTSVTYLIVRNDPTATPVQQSTAAVLALFLIATWVLVVVARPLEWWKVVLIAVMVGAFAFSILVPFAQSFWLLDPGHGPTLLVAVVVAAVGAVLVEVSARVVGRRLD